MPRKSLVPTLNGHGGKDARSAVADLKVGKEVYLLNGKCIDTTFHTIWWCKKFFNYYLQSLSH